MKIALIAPYDGILDIARELITQYDYDLDMTFGELQCGADKANAYIQDGITVFISRGGTAKSIQQLDRAQVVEIQVTGYDLLRAIKSVEGEDRKIGVVGYKNVIEGMHTIAMILDIEIEYIEIESENQIEAKLNYARELGVEVVIGDTLATRVARTMNFDAVLIKSGREAILNAIKEASQLNEAIEKEKVDKRRYRTILESIAEGVIAVDNKGKVILFNRAAKRMYKIDQEDLINASIEELIPDTRIPQFLKSWEPQIDSIERIGTLDLAVNRMPVVLDGINEGVVATFRDITRIQELEQKFRHEILQKGFRAKRTFDDIIANDEDFKKVVNKAREYAKSNSTILINGESGTGKEVFAQSIHNGSLRSKGPFVAVNCASLPSNLLESELFGYAEGAFTGARKGGKKGLFELAHTGTIFLDEIGEMDVSVQARILRVIQEKEVMRLGDDRIIPVDVRIVAATNRSLWEMVRDQSFRDDLFYRINVLNIMLPPLRDRVDDLRYLCQDLLKRVSRQYDTVKHDLNDTQIQELKDYHWPGNIRELQNVMERFVITGEIEILEMPKGEHPDDGSVLLTESMDKIKKIAANQVLEKYHGNKSQTARHLGITRVTLDRLLET